MPTMPRVRARGLFYSCLLVHALLPSHAFAMPPPHDPRTPAASSSGNGLARRLGAAVPRCGGADDATSSRASPASALAGAYMRQLEAHELRTKFVSAAVLSLAGDAVAQTIGHRMQLLSHGGSITRAASLDKRRLLAMFVDGLLFTGPLLHGVYEIYERILPTTCAASDPAEDGSAAKRRRLFATLVHVLFDNFVMVFVYVAVLMVTTAVMEGRHSVIPHELRHDLLPSVKVSWKVSIAGYVPLQLLSFHYLPQKLRVLAVNVLDVIWVTVMSYVTHMNRH